MSSRQAVSETREFFYNDIVCRLDRHQRVHFGAVTDSYNSIDYNTSTDLRKGQLRIWWPGDGYESAWSAHRVRLLNRTILPGDIVRRIQNGKESQRGYCQMASQHAAVSILGSKLVLERVSFERLLRNVPITTNTPVLVNNKIGRVGIFDRLLTLKSRCDSTVKILYAENSSELRMSLERDGDVVLLHLGMELTITPANLINANWLQKSKLIKRNGKSRHKFYVHDVKCANVNVCWFNGDSKTPTESMLTDEEIEQMIVLPSVESQFADLAEYRLLKLRESDMPMRKKSWSQLQAVLLRGSSGKVTHSVRGKKSNKLKVRPAILPTSPIRDKNPDLDWCTDEEEVSRSDDEPKSVTSILSAVPSTLAPKLREIPHRYLEVYARTGKTQNFHDIMRVALRKGKETLSLSDLVLYVSVKILCLYSKATVVWQDGTVESGIPTCELNYSISLDDHEFFPGEWVKFRSADCECDRYGIIQSADFVQRTAMVKWYAKLPVTAADESTVSEYSVYDLTKYVPYCFRAGHVVKLLAPHCEPSEPVKLGAVVDGNPNGCVTVTWHTQETKDHWPSELELIPEDLDDYSMSGDDDDEVFSLNNSWETESIESLLCDANDISALQTMASRLDFVRSRLVYLKEALRQNNFSKFWFLRDLLIIYDNSSHLDKLLDTSFFSLQSKHYQAILAQVKEFAKANGIEVRGRIFSEHSATASVNIPFSKSVQKVQKIEQQLSIAWSNVEEAAPVSQGITTSVSPTTPTQEGVKGVAFDNLHIELLSMLKTRMDLAYAEIIARIGGDVALTVMTKASDNELKSHSLSTSTPHLRSYPTSPDSLLGNSSGSAGGVMSASTPAMATKTTTGDFVFTPPPRKPMSHNNESPVSVIEQQPLPPVPSSAVANDASMSLNDDSSSSSGTASNNESNAFQIIPESSPSHKFFNVKIVPTKRNQFFQRVCMEHQMMRTSLPPGVWVRAYGDRLDLCSIVIRGPAKTPYEDGLFIFELQFSPDYPRSPPVCHYVSYCSDRLNPNLYVEGKVCVSLLGTWFGKDTENWRSESTMLQLIVSIQGLILVSEPYFNEAGYEKQIDSQQGRENSRTYNEQVILKLVQSMTAMLKNPPAGVDSLVRQHFAEVGPDMCRRMRSWCDGSMTPEFLLAPVTRGLKISLEAALLRFEHVLTDVLAKHADCTPPQTEDS